MLTKNWMESRYTIGSLVARSAAMQRLIKQAGMQINNDSPLLVVGETGTGKTLLARSIHNSSSRVSRPFVSAASERLTPNAADGVLFGTTSEKGLLARSESGTLLITGVENLAPMAQERLCKLIDDGKYTTASGDQKKLDMRMMFTGNSGVLAERMSHGMFSEDLYARISGSVLSMPSLSERNADIPYLVVDVLQAFAARERVSRPTVPYHYMELLTRVEWPENVQQLRNHVESVMALSNGHFDPAILLAHFDEIESPQTLKGLVRDLLQRLVTSSNAVAAAAAAGN